MKQSLVTMALVAAVVLGSSLGWHAVAGADDPSTISDVMRALHKGPQATLGQLKAKMSSGSPDWAAIKPLTASYLKEVEKLPGQEPPKGEKADFESQVKSYLASSKSLDEAAGEKDGAAAKKAFMAIGASCKDCHSAHKP